MPLYLNLGCGKVILPDYKPKHHKLIPAEVYDQSFEWHNVDRVKGADVKQIDLFRYPWPLPSNFYDGALIAHLVEHIPHTSYVAKHFRYDAPDGFFAFFYELHRVLKPGAVAHILAPFAYSGAATIDPTHTRMVIPATFDYLTARKSGAPYDYELPYAFEFLTSLGNNLEAAIDLNPLAKIIVQQTQDFYVALRKV